MSQQLQAGYALECLQNNPTELPSKLELDGLLYDLSHFDVVTNLNLTERPTTIDPVTTVVNNLLTRGLPTRMSVFLEGTFATTFGKTKQIIERGSLSFPQTNSEIDPSVISQLFDALHIIEPRLRLNSNNYAKDGLLGSDFERNFLFEYVGFENNYLAQILCPQAPLSHFVNQKICTGFAHGGKLAHGSSVDFATKIPYIIQGNDETNKEVTDAYIIEIDGQHHLQKSQVWLDRLRDAKTSESGTTTLRVAAGHERAGINNILTDFEKQPYFQKIKQNFNNTTFDTARLDNLQLALSPFAIARVQKVILESILRGTLTLDADTWHITIVERDVPCAYLAVEDLKKTFENLYILRGHGQLPKIELRVFATPEFKPAKLNLPNVNNITFGAYDGQDCDLFIDIATLERSGLTHITAHPKNYFIIRSASYPKSFRQFYTSEHIIYKPIVEEIENETYPSIPSQEQALTYFLTNIFRKTSFREGQLPILSRALQAKSVIGLLPTGGGKSLTYQLAALLQPGICLVVDPIRSLMQDQYDNLLKIGIDACNFINSTLKTHERNYNIAELASGRLLFTFVSPERLLIHEFRLSLENMFKQKHYFNYCVIDEVHCVSEWGHDFRTSYLALGENARKFCKPKNMPTIPLFGLTATASFDVLSDVERELDVHDPNAVIRFENTLREELQYDIQEVMSDWAKIALPHPLPPAVGSSAWVIRNNIAQQKQISLNKLIEAMPKKLADLNNENQINKSLEASFEQFLSEKQREKFQNQKENYIEHKLSIVQIKDFKTATFFENSGGLIFCPHRGNGFGVTDKFETIKGAGGIPMFKPVGDHSAIADLIKTPFFKQAIPLSINELEIRSSDIGTFVGSSDESKDVSQAIQDDSFRNQRLFINGKLKLMVATKAFGMGIDKPNIRYTVHFNIPSSIESFVQETGRGGRDQKLALGVMLYNRQKVYVFTEKSFKNLRKQGHDTADFQWLIGFYFEETDFKTLLTRIEKPDWKDFANEMNVDRSNLEFFYHNSFKGIDKEKVMIYELRQRISFPKMTQQKSLSEQLSLKFSREIELSYWQNPDGNLKRLYVDENGIGIGFINCNELITNYLPNNHPEMVNYLRTFIFEHFEGILPDANLIGTWLRSVIERPDIDGIEVQLNGIEIGENLEINIGFSNKYADDAPYFDALLIVLKQEFNPHLTAANLKIAFNNKPETPAELLEFLDIQAEVTPKLAQKFYARRTKADTDKALYRLLSLGIIEDYTVDYLTSEYTLYLTKQTPAYYAFKLYEYVKRYYSEARAKREIQQITSIKLKNTEGSVTIENIEVIDEKMIIRDCVNFLTDFIYSQIARKRYLAIGDMQDACEVFLSNDDGNQAFKEYIFLYFNSKYARSRYEAKLENVDESAAYSLTDETEQAKNNLTLARVFDYIALMNKDKSGGAIDNIKHLRGAATRLLRTNPDNAALQLLKAFSYFVLGSSSETLFKEAETSGLNGFMHYFKEFEGDEVKKLAEKVAEYRHIILEYAPERYHEKINETIGHWIDIILVKYHAEWLKNFNQKFLTNDESRNTNRAKRIAESVVAA